MKNNSIKKNRLLEIVANGIELWIRSRVKSIEDIQIELQGSIFGILRGQLLGINFYATKANFQGLNFCEARLQTGRINIQIDFSKKSKLTLKNDFNVFGKVNIEGKSLENNLLDDSWKWLGEWICIELMGKSELISIEFLQNKIKLKAFIKDLGEIVDRRFKISNHEGSILIYNEEYSLKAILPMDQSIFIDKAYIANYNLIIEGNSKVNI